MRPLEDRFPTLYWNIVHERAAGSDEVKEKRTPKPDPPTLFDAVQAICSVHRVTDTGLMKDLAESIGSFQILTEPPRSKKGRVGKIELPDKGEDE